MASSLITSAPAIRLNYSSGMDALGTYGGLAHAQPPVHHRGREAGLLTDPGEGPPALVELGHLVNVAPLRVGCLIWTPSRVRILPTVRQSVSNRSPSWYTVLRAQ